MKPLLKLAYCLIFILGFLKTSSNASPSLQKYETYLNNLKTLAGTFTQINSKGHKATGNVHISRPGKLRLTYHAPSSLIVVSDGKWLVTYDREADESNYVSLENTPAGFILRPRISFQEGVIVTQVIQKGDITEISLVRAEDPDAGTISLSFTNTPVSLKEWSVIDPQGIETRVCLSNLKSNISLPSELFRIKSPTLLEQIF